MQIDAALNGAARWMASRELLTSEFAPPGLLMSRFGESVGLERPATNAILNPSIETSTSGWAPTAGATPSRVTTDAVVGGAALQVVASAMTLQGEVHPFAAVVGQSYTVSAWVKAPAGRSLTLRLQEHDGAKSDVATATEVQDGDWRRMAVAGVATQTTMRLRVDTGADDSGFTFLVDGAQSEAGTYVTSYVDGDQGEGYAWTDTAHASTSTREAGRLRVEGALLDPYEGGVAAYLRPHWGVSDAGEHVVFHRQAAGDAMLLAFDDGIWRLTSTRGAQEASVSVDAAHAPGADILVVAGWTPRTLVLEVGGMRAVAPRAGGPPSLVAARWLELGRRSDAEAGWFDGALGPVLFLDGVPSTGEVEVLARLPQPPRPGQRFGRGVGATLSEMR